MEEFNMDQLRLALQKIEEEEQAASQTNEEALKQKKVAKLIVILQGIEKELSIVKDTLTKLKAHSLRNKNITMVSRIDDKLETVKRLTIKIQKARLNLSWYFL